jgi:hypothetical protein
MMASLRPKYASAFAASGSGVIRAILPAIRWMSASHHLCISRGRKCGRGNTCRQLRAKGAWGPSGSLRSAADRSNSTLTTVATPFKKRGIIHVDMKRRGVITM